MIPAIQPILARVDELNGDLQVQQDAEVARLQAERPEEITLAMA